MKQIFTLIILITLTSCSFNKQEVLTLSTDLPEILPLIEQFNKENSDINIIIQSEMTKKDSDIIIFKGQPQDSPSKTKDLKYLLSQSLANEDFYGDILKYTKTQNDTMELLPLTFDIPGLMYNKNRFNHERVIRLEDFIDNKTIKFSPFWEEDFIIWYYLSKLPSFEKESNYMDYAVFYSTAKKINNMLIDNNDKWDEELFNNKYMHLSPELLIESDIIEYYFINFSDYIKINNKYRKDIAFSFLSTNDLIIASETLTYIGIISESNNKKAAEKVIVWILNKKNQNSYIANNIKDSGLSDLFLGQLSTLTSVSSELIPYHYPKLAPFIPDSNKITIPYNLPPLWQSLKKQVFVPAFLETKNLSEDQWLAKYNNLYKEWLKKHKK